MTLVALESPGLMSSRWSQRSSMLACRSAMGVKPRWPNWLRNRPNVSIRPGTRERGAVLTRGDESMEGQVRGPESRFAGPPASSTPQERPSTLMEAISKRIVDAVAVEVATVTAQVQDIGTRADRLDSRLDRIEALLAERPIVVS